MYILQVIALAIYAIVMISAWRNFKQTILVWVPMSLLFNPQVSVTYNPPITALTVATDLSLVLLYFLKYRDKDTEKLQARKVVQNIEGNRNEDRQAINTKLPKQKQNKYGFNCEPFFFLPAIVFMAISYMISTIFSDMPFASSFNKIVKQLVDYFGMIYLVFRCINTKQDIILFVKALAFSAFIFCTDGIVEGIVQENFWADFIFFTSKCDETTEGRGWQLPYSLGGGNWRYGMLRCYSVFALHLIFGFACCISSYVMFKMRDAKIKLIDKFSQRVNNYIYIILLSMLALSIIMCNSKGPMILAVFILLTRYKFNQLFNIWTITPLIIGVIVIAVYFPDYINNWISLTDEDVAAEGGGSSVATREMQYATALKLFWRSPIFGNGIEAVKYFKQFGFQDILGAESIWLKLLPDQGIFGVIAYLYMWVVLIQDAEHNLPLKIYSFFFLGLFVFDVTNGSAYTKILWWMSAYLLIRRYYILKRRNKKKKWVQR